MNSIKYTSNLVKEQLTEYPATRDDDMLLYYRVCDKINSIAFGMPFGMVVVNLKHFKLPAFETVRRTRQKLQAENSDLRGTESTRRKRTELEGVYRNYARGEV